MLRSNRRSFLKTALAPMLLGAEVSPARGAQRSTSSPTFIATWKQGLPAVNRAAEVLNDGGSLLDAVEKGINTAELDPEVTSVGYGGLPNEDGVVELDAAIMDGAATPLGRGLQPAQYSNSDFGGTTNPRKDEPHHVGRARRVSVCPEDGLQAAAAAHGNEPDKVGATEGRSRPEILLALGGESRHHRAGGDRRAGEYGLGLLDLGAGMEDCRAGGGFTPGRLRRLRRQSRRGGLGNRRRRPDDKLLHQRPHC